MAWLLYEREGESERLELTGPGTSIGRGHHADLRLRDDKLVSSVHCTIRKTPTGWMVEDNNSSNGTRVNGKLLLDGKHALVDGDCICIGSTELRFRDAATLPPGSPSSRPSFLRRLGGLFRRG